MGLKSGSRDAGLAAEDDPTDEAHREESTEETQESQHTVEDSANTADVETASSNQSATPSTASSEQGGSSRPALHSIPYKLRRDKVNEGREQVPYFLRPQVIDAEDELQDQLEEILGEDVYKSDYREASMVVAQRHPELVAAVLREWGYDLDE